MGSEMCIRDRSEGFIPYEEVLGNYVTKEEVIAKYNALKVWYEEHGHFWVGNGPFYLDKVDVTGKIVTLKAFRQYIDKADKWIMFTEPMTPEVMLSGPSTVTPGEATTFDVTIMYKGEPYPSEEIEFVKYIMLDSEGNVVLKGEATPVADGQWKITLSESDTEKLVPGTYTVEAFALSKLVCLPQYDEVHTKVTVESYVDMMLNKMRAEMETRLSGLEANLVEQIQSLQNAIAALNMVAYASAALAVIAIIVGIAAIAMRRRK